MRLLVTGGGTGGHVYPALAVVEALRADAAYGIGPEDVAWVGERDSAEERILAREGADGHHAMPFFAVRAGALRGANPIKAARSIADLTRGHRQARRIVEAFRPQVVLATGGYVSVPLVLAAHRAGCGVLIYLPDVEPGLAVRWLSRYADRVAVSFDGVVRHLPGADVVVTGYPVRRALFETTRSAAREALGLPPDATVLLIFGGSRGARAINRATRAALSGMLERAHVIHVTGIGDAGESDGHDESDALGQRLGPALSDRYHPYSYLYEGMTDALVASNLVVARAGAATLGEFPAVGLPAVLVPYPHSGKHQHVNAEYLASRGAAVVVEDGELDEQLLPVVCALLDDRPRLLAMAEAARRMAVPGAAGAIARHLADLAGRRAAKGA